MIWIDFIQKKSKFDFHHDKNKCIEYLDILGVSLVPFKNKFEDQNSPLLQDNVPIYNSVSTSKSLCTSKVKSLDFSAKRHDLNFIETL